MQLALFGIGTIAIIILLLFGYLKRDTYGPAIMLTAFGYGILFSLAAQTDGVISTQTVYTGTSWVTNDIPIGNYDLIPVFISMAALLSFITEARMYWGKVGKK